MPLLHTQLFSVESRIRLLDGKHNSFHMEVPNVLRLSINSGYFIRIEDINLEKWLNWTINECKAWKCQHSHAHSANANKGEKWNCKYWVKFLSEDASWKLLNACVKRLFKNEFVLVMKLWQALFVVKKRLCAVQLCLFNRLYIFVERLHLNIYLHTS